MYHSWASHTTLVLCAKSALQHPAPTVHAPRLHCLVQSGMDKVCAHHHDKTHPRRKCNVVVQTGVASDAVCNGRKGEAGRACGLAATR